MLIIKVFILWLVLSVITTISICSMTNIIKKKINKYAKEKSKEVYCQFTRCRHSAPCSNDNYAICPKKIRKLVYEDSPKGGLRIVCENYESK